MDDLLAVRSLCLLQSPLNRRALLLPSERVPLPPIAPARAHEIHHVPADAERDASEHASTDGGEEVDHVAHLKNTLAKNNTMVVIVKPRQKQSM
jgi:hypothetical protein